jgi:hypothetical protein
MRGKPHLPGGFGAILPVCRTLGQPSPWCQVSWQRGSGEDTIVDCRAESKRGPSGGMLHAEAILLAVAIRTRTDSSLRFGMTTKEFSASCTAGLGVSCSGPVSQSSRVGGSGLGVNWFACRRTVKLANFINLVGLFLAAGGASKMENLAFLVPPNRRLRAFRFDAGYQRRYGNRVLAMKTNNTTV